MWDHYQEHLDHVMGEATEQQNLYTISCLNRVPDDSAKIKELVKAGRWCVVEWVEDYCRYTDAALPGGRQILLADYATEQEAYQHGEKEDVYWIVIGHKPVEPVIACDSNDEIPF